MYSVYDKSVVICTNVTIVILVDQMIQGLDIYGRGITLKLVIQLVLSEPQGNPNIITLIKYNLLRLGLNYVDRATGT